MPTRQARGGSATALLPTPTPPLEPHHPQGAVGLDHPEPERAAQRGAWLPVQWLHSLARCFDNEFGRNVSPGTRVPPLTGRALFPAGACGPDKQHRATPCLGLRSAQELSLYPLARPRLGVPSSLPLPPPPRHLPPHPGLSHLSLLPAGPTRPPSGASGLQGSSSQPLENPPPSGSCPPPPSLAARSGAGSLPAPGVPSGALTALWPGPSLSPAASRTVGAWPCLTGPRHRPQDSAGRWEGGRGAGVQP